MSQNTSSFNTRPSMPPLLFTVSHLRMLCFGDKTLYWLCVPFNSQRVRRTSKVINGRGSRKLKNGNAGKLKRNIIQWSILCVEWIRMLIRCPVFGCHLCFVPFALWPALSRKKNALFFFTCSFWRWTEMVYI